MGIFFNNNMNTIVINETRIETNGNNISVSGNSIYVDGKLVKDGLSGVVKIQFEGDLANLKSDGSITVNGNIKGYVDCGGSFTCEGDVGGDVDAGGSVTIKK